MREKEEREKEEREKERERERGERENGWCNYGQKESLTECDWEDNLKMREESTE